MFILTLLLYKQTPMYQRYGSQSGLKIDGLLFRLKLGERRTLVGTGDIITGNLRGRTEWLLGLGCAKVWFSIRQHTPFRIKS